VISAKLDTSVYIRALHFGGPATVIIGHALEAFASTFRTR
jgi:hypothetical protein